MKKFLLGISAGFHDSSACLVDTDGVVHYASSEERFTRKKGDKKFPSNAIEECIRYSEFNNGRIVKICLHENPAYGFPKPYYSPLKNYIKTNLRYLESVKSLLSNLREVSNRLSLNLTDIFLSRHHISHAYSAIATSYKDSGIVFVLDAIGENYAGLIGHFENNRLREYSLIPIQESLGIIYSLVTVYCGFKVLTGEYKLMGLAPYGKPRFINILNDIFWNEKTNKPTIADVNIFSKRLFSRQLESRLGFPPRDQNSDTITQRYADLAASIQLFLEVKVEYLLDKYIATLDKERVKSLVLSGGVALNCKLNYVLSERFKSNLEEIWAYPASGDAGSSVGACVNYLSNSVDEKRFIQTENSVTMFLGSEYENSELMCKNYSISYHKSGEIDLRENQLISKVCSLLREGKIGAVYENRSEFGPRALGNRSIIADATNKDALRAINKNVKNREDFRPLAPIVLESQASKYFELNNKCANMYKYMLCLAKSKNFQYEDEDNDIKDMSERIEPQSSQDKLIPAVVHHDGTARIQTISDSQKSTIAHLLKCYLREYNTGLLVNTSFNVRGEPIVNTPIDALDCFLEASLDFLILDNIFIFRDEQNSFILDVARKDFELD